MPLPRMTPRYCIRFPRIRRTLRACAESRRHPPAGSGRAETGRAVPASLSCVHLAVRGGSTGLSQPSPAEASWAMMRKPYTLGVNASNDGVRSLPGQAATSRKRTRRPRCSSHKVRNVAAKPRHRLSGGTGCSPCTTSWASLSR